MDKRTKFTPGPWHPIQEREHHATSGDGHYLPKWMIYDSKNAWCICSTGSTWPTEEEEDANAHLIAAAPEMYGCLLEACAEMCHNLSEDTGYCRYLDREAMLCRQLDGECFVQKWIKALAKARGEVRE